MEDMCVLMKKSSQAKYTTSYENVAKAIKLNCTDKQQNIEQLFSYIVFSCLVGNGDAHLKNFSVLYTQPNEDIFLSPLYDVVCTQPYPTTDNRLALSMNKSKEFPTYKGLLQFGKTIGLNKPEIIIEKMADQMSSFIQQCDLWPNFPALKVAIQKTLSYGMSRSKGDDFNFDFKRVKKRKH